jgi:hypothetical protein
MGCEGNFSNSDLSSLWTTGLTHSLALCLGESTESAAGSDSQNHNGIVMDS